MGKDLGLSLSKAINVGFEQSGLRMLQELGREEGFPVGPSAIESPRCIYKHLQWALHPAQSFPLIVFFNPQIRDKDKECLKTMMSKAIQIQKWQNLSLLRLPIKTTLRFLHEGPDTVEELLDRHVVRNRPSTSSVLVEEEEERLARRRLTSTRREALGLYRDILRATRFFLWTDARGVPWRDVLRENARKEFEDARFEKDPEVLTRLLIGGRDAVDSALERLAEKQRIEIEKQRRG